MLGGFEMKIIEEGNGWSIQERCTGKYLGDGGCNSLLLLSKEDLYFDREICDGHSTKYFFAFQCPLCGLWTNIEPDRVPYNIKKQLLFDENGSYKQNIKRKIR